MSFATDQWKTQLRALSSAERAELAEFLLRTLDEEEADIEAAWDAEATRRAREVAAGKVSGRPLEEFLDEMRNRKS